MKMRLRLTHCRWCTCCAQNWAVFHPPTQSKCKSHEHRKLEVQWGTSFSLSLGMCWCCGNMLLGVSWGHGALCSLFPRKLCAHCVGTTPKVSTHWFARARKLDCS